MNAGDASDKSATGPSRVRKIIHVDMDAFYASVEQRDNPALRGRPLAVGHGRARGVVAAARYEARAFGVHSAMPSVTALRKCPELVFVPPRFEVYRAVSQKIRDIFARRTPLIEPLALDEAYLDVTDFLAEGETAASAAEDIRAAILAETGLTASAGVSYNKFLAKMASGQRKPNGQFVITPKTGPAFVAALPVKKFHGVGPATAEKMRRLGIETGADLKACAPEFLQKHFGKAGGFFHAIARGIDDRPVRPDRACKSIGAESTFLEDVFSFDVAREKIAPIVQKVWAACEHARMSGRTVTVKVKFADFQQLTRAHSEPAAVSSTADLLRRSLALLAPLFPPPKGIRLLGVTVSAFEEGPEMRQLGFEFPAGEA